MKIIAIEHGRRFKFGVAIRGRIVKSVRSWATARQALAAGQREFGQ